MEREPVVTAVHLSRAGSGWGPWSLDALDAPMDAAATPLAWLGTLTVVLWGCATALALQFL